MSLDLWKWQGGQAGVASNTDHFWNVIYRELFKGTQGKFVGGTYTGNGTSKSINIGFEANLVLVFCLAIEQPAAPSSLGGPPGTYNNYMGVTFCTKELNTSLSGAGSISLLLSYTVTCDGSNICTTDALSAVQTCRGVNNSITNLSDTGFTVGANVAVNRSGYTYLYFAFGDLIETNVPPYHGNQNNKYDLQTHKFWEYLLKELLPASENYIITSVGQYTGNGASFDGSTRTIDVGFATEAAFIWTDPASAGTNQQFVYSDINLIDSGISSTLSGSTADINLSFGNATVLLDSANNSFRNGFTDFSSTGFTTKSLNVTGTTYSYFVIGKKAIDSNVVQVFQNASSPTVLLEQNRELESLLENKREITKIKFGTYLGTGAAQTIETTFAPKVLFIFKNPSANNQIAEIIISQENDNNASFITESASAIFSQTATAMITAFGDTSFSLGTSTRVNQSGRTFSYMAIG